MRTVESSGLTKLTAGAVSVYFLVFAQFFFCTGCGGGDTQPTAAAPQNVVVSKVVKRDVPTIMEFVGETKGAIDAEIRARVEGVVTSIHFEEGKEVKKDQLLYTIDPAPFQAKVAEAMGKLAEAETRKAKATADVGRYKPLAEIKAVSARTLDAAVAEEGAAAGAVDAAKAALESAQIELGYTKITSPTNGIIGMTKARVGEFVGKPPNPVILNTVSNLEDIHVKFSVTEQEYLMFARLRRDQLEAGVEPQKRVLELILADGSVHPEKGEVAFAERQVDAKTGTLAIEARFPNPHQLIRPGQYAKIRSDIGTKKDALLVPKRAVAEMQGQYSVFVVKADNTVEQRTVKVAGIFEDFQVIESGLTESETIVTEGIQRLKPGMAVNPQQGGK